MSFQVFKDGIITLGVYPDKDGIKESSECVLFNTERCNVNIACEWPEFV